MGVPVTRVGTDIGIGVCLSHIAPASITVTLMLGSSTVLTNGMPTGIFGSLGLCSCGHPSTALLAAGTVKATGLGAHRMGDVGQPPSGTYTMVSGSSNTLAGA